ncbi:acyl-CoA dehydrogenase family protein [Frankia sp. Cas3]|uniref:acyl-CoA dehydrogenase family protein n=1 Tax=Frankia sp. Cas3 TaxID=3073926 RepID=UPI002AD570A5|nr:acyl-CoA dehydrogenase family protein [Frankia sp. Cas3]
MGVRQSDGDPDGAQDLEAFRRRARSWLAEHAPSREGLGPGAGAEGAQGASYDVSVFHDLSFDDEKALIERVAGWHRQKIDAGFGALDWPREDGGVGLGPEFVEAFAAEETRFAVPPAHELVSVTVHLIAPTIGLVGTPEQRDRLLRTFLRAERLCCQLFSEPGAGSDLAALGTRAVRDGDGWVVNGQKVWSSGAQFAAWGMVLVRTDPDVPKHAGITAFLLPLDTPGVTVRPLRQMSGGTSFNEVFLDDVRIPDSLRLGAVGAGWKVALTTLGFEREATGGHSGVGGGWRQLAPLACALGRFDDPLVRQKLADVYISERLAEVASLREAAGRASGRPGGPEGSLRKLHWVRSLALASVAAEAVLGARLVADTGEWGTFAWTAHILGAPGYRIAGGSDEIQRTIIAERLLGLPSEERVDRNRPWREIPR